MKHDLRNTTRINYIYMYDRFVRDTFETGCRVGEFGGLRWEDVDMEKRTISVNHCLVYDTKRKDKDGYTNQSLSVFFPKTAAGIRIIPMLDSVKEVLEMVYEEQLETGSCE